MKASYNSRYQDTKPEPLSERTPAVNSVHLSDISIRGAWWPIAIYGLEEKMFHRYQLATCRLIQQEENLSKTNLYKLHDIGMEIKEGNALEAKDSKGISYDNISLISRF